MVLALVQNVALIVMLASIQQYLLRRIERNYIASRLVSGVLFGAVAVVAMATPLVLAPGLIFDGRSIILAIAGLFGGPLVAVVAAIIAGVYRASLGGPGALAGVLVVVESAFLGVVFYYLRRRLPSVMRGWSLLGFGLLVHVFMLGTQIVFLPDHMGWGVVRRIGPAVIVLFPLATLLVARFILDQEEREADRRQLADDAERLRLALEAAEQGTWDLDVRSGRVAVSAEYASMLGYDPGAYEITRDRWVGDLHPDDRERVVRAYEEFAAGAIPEYRVEFRQRAASGEYRWMLALGSIVERDEHDAPTRMVGTHTDISARKAAEAEEERYREDLEELVAERTSELEQMNAELASATTAKSVFLASMSHELRTPLNSIIGFSGLLAQGMAGPLTDEQRTQIEMIHGSGRHLLALIDDVLDLERVEAGRVEVRPAPFDGVALVAEVIDVMRPLADEKGLELSADVSDSALEIVSDSGKVRQILLNLVGNAVKFTAEGSVEVR
ncbi:MAG: LytS/YhcK type 5TM receptor domain-containing protein, partial [Actinomycetota bacterium]|nr:LytS/YhcK type 5TM receptor domain-containing protein [Actinomycetota bacterium]